MAVDIRAIPVKFWGYFSTFQRISLVMCSGCFRHPPPKTDPTTWLNPSKSLINRCSSFPETRLSYSNVTLNMTLADENSWFWTFFDDLRLCFATCLNATESVSYRPYEKNLTTPADSAHQNVLHSDNQQSQKPGFLTQVKPKSKRCSTSGREHSIKENRHNTVRGPELADALNPCDAPSFRIAKTSREKRRDLGRREAYFESTLKTTCTCSWIIDGKWKNDHYKWKSDNSSWRKCAVLQVSEDVL